jgi:hypothetical protein
MVMKADIENDGLHFTDHAQDVVAEAAAADAMEDPNPALWHAFAFNGPGAGFELWGLIRIITVPMAIGRQWLYANCLCRDKLWCTNSSR